MADNGSSTGTGGTRGTGPTLNGSIEGMLTPELLYKMNKKIAQLTKVVYGLNTRGEELETQLAQGKVAEDGLREANADLQRRANLYRSKLDSEGSVGSGEAQFYKMECDTLKRRLDELQFGEVEQSRRREQALQRELEQAVYTLSGIKGHHECMIRERESQFAMDCEKLKLEWQARLTEVENRYKTQVRHLTDDRDAARSESDMMRRRVQTAAEDTAYRDQLTSLNFDREREKREWELKLQLKQHELEEERIRSGQDKREREARIRQLNEERRREVEQTEDRFRSNTKSLEDRLQRAEEERSKLNRKLEEKDAEFECRLKSKVKEWKSQWDAVEDNLQAEILTLKRENAALQATNALEGDAKVRHLEEELQQKAADYDLLAKNLKMRIGVIEMEAKNLSAETKSQEKQLKEEKERAKQQQYRSNLQVEALERHLREETERHKITQGQYDKLSSRVKGDLESQLKLLQVTETTLREENTRLLLEGETAQAEVEGLSKKLREKEKEHQQQLEKDVKIAEAKVKSRLEKSWLEKLRRTEETAAQDMERMREGHKRIEADLKKEITMLQKGEIEAKRLNEEFKKKVRQLRQSETELTTRLAQTEADYTRERSVSRSISRSGSAVNVSKSGSSLNLHNANLLDVDSGDRNRKELSSLETKFEEQVQQLTLALSLKQEELAKSKAEAEKLLKQSEERSRREQQELHERNKKEQQELKDRLEKEKKDLEEQHKAEKEERDKKDIEERQKIEEEKETLRKAAENASTNNDSNDSSEDTGDDEEKESNDEEEESEAECNRRKIDKLQMELLLLKQQNEEFEEMVREKHRRQIELELQIGDIGKEMTAKEAMVDSVKVELCYAKNETELTKARVKRMEEELAQYKEKVESLEHELDTSERELRRMEILQEKLQVTEAKRNEMQSQLDDVEVERDEEIKIIQDALDEAAQEREELLTTFEKEIEKLNSVNAAREAQMLEDFEAKLLELEKQHKAKLEEKERQSETRGKRQPDQEEIRQRIDKMKSELNSEWEDKLRNECSRLKGELDTLHVEEKHLAVESIKVQKEQELQNLKKTFESKSEEMNKEISTLKESLSTKDAFYHQELDEIRTRADRDLWEMRRKLQKLDESSYDQQQYLEDKHREDIERLREEYSDKMAGMESQLSSVDIRGISDVRAKLEKMHKEQMEHLEEQHRLSMERLRDELESEKFQAAEEARVIVSKHHEYINTSLKEQLTEAITSNTQYREEIEAIRFALSRREEVIRSLEEEIAKLRSSSGMPASTGGSYNSPAATGGHSSSSPFPHEGSQGSRSSQDRLSTEGTDEDGHKASGLLGKVFGGGWFSGTKTKDNTSPGYNNSSAPSKKPRSSS